MGIRSAWKDDLSTSTAEFVYGEQLRLLGDFFNTSPDFVPDYSDFVMLLRLHIKQLQPSKVVRHGDKKIFVFKDLSTCSHVFVRQDFVRKALQQPFAGPYKVVDRHEKYFTIEISNKTISVSIDRLKPAYILSDTINSETESSNF